MEALNRKQILDPYDNLDKAKEFLQLMKQHKEPYSTEVLGQTIVVHPNVYSPKYGTEARFHVENMTCPKGKKVLEVGTGTGTVALFCALRGATLVHAVDINKSAIANAQENFARNYIDEQHFKVYYSDVFSNVSEKFDIIHFLPPLCATKAEDDFEKAGFDEGYSTIRRFMAEAGSYLEPDGRICLVWTDVADMALMRELIQQNGYQMEKFYERREEDGFTEFLLILKKENK